MKIVEFSAVAGQVLGASLFPVNGDSVLASASSVLEQGNTKGMYLAEFATFLIGTYLMVAYDVTVSPPVAVSESYVYLTDAEGIYRSGNYVDVVSESRLELVRAITVNKTVTDPVTGIMTVYEDDDVTPFLTAQLYEDAEKTQIYRGAGSELRERLE